MYGFFVILSQIVFFSPTGGKSSDGLTFSGVDFFSQSLLSLCNLSPRRGEMTAYHIVPRRKSDCACSNR